MSDLDVFRQDFSGILTRCAKARRSSLCGGVGHGDDLKIIALFERLAREAETLDPTVFARCRAAPDQGLGTPCLVPRRDALLAQVGILYWPKDAADLVGWMRTQSSVDLDLDLGLDSKPGPAMAPPRRFRGRASPDPATGSRGLARSWASDFTGGFGVVAPILSLWTVRAAFGQMRDHAFMSQHTAVPATVVSVDPLSMGKSSGAESDVVLSFQQPSGETCRVTWRADSPGSSWSPGATLDVVPRSSACETPLIPSTVGDPMQTLALAAALMAGGLVSLKAWAWLFHHSPEPTSRPSRMPAGTAT